MYCHGGYGSLVPFSLRHLCCPVLAAGPPLRLTAPARAVLLMHCHCSKLYTGALCPGRTCTKICDHATFMILLFCQICATKRVPHPSGTIFFPISSLFHECRPDRLLLMASTVLTELPSCNPCRDGMDFEPGCTRPREGLRMQVDRRLHGACGCRSADDSCGGSNGGGGAGGGSCM